MITSSHNLFLSVTRPYCARSGDEILAWMQISKHCNTEVLQCEKRIEKPLIKLFELTIDFLTKQGKIVSESLLDVLEENPEHSVFQVRVQTSIPKVKKAVHHALVTLVTEIGNDMIKPAREDPEFSRGLEEHIPPHLIDHFMFTLKLKEHHLLDISRIKKNGKYLDDKISGLVKFMEKPCGSYFAWKLPILVQFPCETKTMNIFRRAAGELIESGFYHSAIHLASDRGFLDELMEPSSKQPFMDFLYGKQMFSVIAKIIIKTKEAIAKGEAFLRLAEHPKTIDYSYFGGHEKIFEMIVILPESSFQSYPDGFINVICALIQGGRPEWEINQLYSKVNCKNCQFFEKLSCKLADYLLYEAAIKIANIINLNVRNGKFSQTRALEYIVKKTIAQKENAIGLNVINLIPDRQKQQKLRQEYQQSLVQQLLED